MKTQVEMWIDHREANIVFLSQDGEETKQIKSTVEKQLRRSGDSPSNERFETQMATKNISINTIFANGSSVSRRRTK